MNKKIANELMKIARELVAKDLNTVDGLVDELQKTVEKIFPDSYVNVAYSNRLYGSIRIFFTLGANKGEYANGIIDNDPALTSITIDTKDGELEDVDLTDVKLVAEISRGNGFNIYPREEDKYLAMGTIKVPFRKTTGDSKKIVQKIDKYFKTLKQKMKEHKDELYDSTGKLQNKL